MKKNKKILMFTLIILIVTFGSIFFNSKDSNIVEKILVKNIQYNGEKISLIEKLEKTKGKTSLILKSKNRERQVDEFLKNNEIPVEIVDVFTFKTKKNEYIVAIINSYFRVNNQDVSIDEFLKGMYIYNSEGKEMHKVEQKFYLNEDMEYQEFDLSNKNLILQKLKELEKDGEL